MEEKELRKKRCVCVCVCVCVLERGSKKKIDSMELKEAQRYIGMPFTSGSEGLQLKP